MQIKTAVFFFFFRKKKNVEKFAAFSPVELACSRLSDSAEDAKVKGTRKVAPSLPSFLPFYFRLRAFSTQRAQLSRSLEQATVEYAGKLSGMQTG